MQCILAAGTPRYRSTAKRLCTIVLLAGSGLSLSGCASLAITALGVGASMGINHTVNGTASRTFTMPLPEIRKAAFAALKRMDFAIDGTKKMASGETIAARAPERDIQVHLEVISGNTTRMRTSARNGLLMDAATANEIIAQTERTFKRI
jgi:Protein of unknown function (DUF3568)